jgi:hypothetical protein
MVRAAQVTSTTIWPRDGVYVTPATAWLEENRPALEAWIECRHGRLTNPRIEAQSLRYLDNALNRTKITTGGLEHTFRIDTLGIVGNHSSGGLIMSGI